jgi:biotin carboxyl carrier protein
MDLRKIKKLIDLLEESNLAEIEIKEGEESVRLARMPRFLVVVEAIDRTARTASLPCVAAEMVYDATSSDHQPEWIASLIHGIITVRSTDQNVIGPLLTSTSAVATGAIGPP